MLRFSVPLAVVAAFAFVSTVSAQAVQIRITAPANGAVLPGPDVTVNIAVTGTTLVPAPEAKKLEDMHVHYVIDTDMAPFLNGSAPFPQGNPKVVHTAALSNTFTGVGPGLHSVYVVLGLSNHLAVQPPVAPFVTFTVGAAGGAAQVPGALPRTGSLDDPSLVGITLLGLAGVVLGTLMRRRISRT